MKIVYQNLRFCQRCILNTSINNLTFRSLCYKSFSNDESPANVLKSVFGCTYHQAYSYIRKYPELKNVDSARIYKTAETLKKLDIDPEELKKFPQVLGLLSAFIEHRSQILKESGFLNITTKNLIYYGTIVKKKISLLKTYGCISESSDVCKNFLECLQAPPQVHEYVYDSIDGHVDDYTISFLRDLVMGYYLQYMLDASEDEMGHIFSTYPRICNKSLKFICETMSILLEELNFSKIFVKKHGYLIQARPWELRKFLKNVPTFGGMPIRDFFYKHPFIALTNYETFSQIWEILRSAGISDEAILETPLVFTLSVQNVQKGIALLNSESKAPEIKALLTHPQMLKLVVRRDYVNQRLNYLNSCDHTSELRPVASLNLLCGSSKVFERYVSGIGGINRGNDVVLYLSKTLEDECKTDEERSLISPVSVRDSLKRHIHWRNIPLADIQSCLEMLLKLGFTCKEIMFSLQIVLYSSIRVKMQLQKLSEESSLSECFSSDDGSDKDTVDGKERKQSASKTPQCDDVIIPSHLRKHALPLCLYFLEKNHHFTGDGIWYRQ